MELSAGGYRRKIGNAAWLRDFMAVSEPVPDPNEKVAMITRENINILKGM